MELINTISNNRTWNKHGVKIVWALATLFLLIVLLSIVWNAYNQSKVKNTNYAPQNIQKIAKKKVANYQVNTIIRANLFGDPNPKPVQKVAPKTTLNLTLQGVLWASDESIARAIITSGKKKSGLYSVGEEIQGAGASIKEIRDREVLLNRNGATESLPLAKNAKKNNKKIITYVDQDNRSAALPASAGSSSPTGQTSISRSTPRTPSASSSNPRKIRKPNFSGLDRALQKIGEL